ncbi:MAG TPA: hypothetical protein VJQ54_00990, partial [Candidatus Sulfotelmatobacter sp.]|nr:hypothetical protein [Candidatus Sulfotelmatobacter sp.]
MRWSGRAFLLVLLASSMFAAAQNTSVTGVATVSSEDLLTQPVAENWTSYNGDYTGRRFSRLQQITPANVAQLRATWVFHAGNSRMLEVTPVVVRGIMYLTSSNDVFAVDAKTGRTLWHYQRPVSSGLLDDAAAHKNRGVAVWKDFVY